MEDMSLTDQQSGHTARRPVTVHVHGGIASGASWRELLYAIINLPLAIALFVLSTVLLTIGAGLTVIYVGIPLLMAGILLSRCGGALYRWLARHLLDTPVLRPAPIARHHSGITGLARDMVTDPVAWRAVAYFLIKIVLAPVTFATAVFFYSGFGLLSYPIWRPFLPAQLGTDGMWHNGAQLWNGYFIDTWPRMAVYAAAGLALVLLAPYVLRRVLAADRLLITALLGARTAASGRA